MQSVMSVRPSLSTLACKPQTLTTLSSDLDFLHVYGSRPWLAGIKSQGHRSGSKVRVRVRVSKDCNVVTSILD